jgi:hypothetical protein
MTYKDVSRKLAGLIWTAGLRLNSVCICRLFCWLPPALEVIGKTVGAKQSVPGTNLSDLLDIAAPLLAKIFICPC